MAGNEANRPMAAHVDLTWGPPLVREWNDGHRRLP
jgi:hypothetical protein